MKTIKLPDGDWLLTARLSDDRRELFNGKGYRLILSGKNKKGKKALLFIPCTEKDNEVFDEFITMLESDEEPEGRADLFPGLVSG